MDWKHHLLLHPFIQNILPIAFQRPNTLLRDAHADELDMDSPLGSTLFSYGEK
jgi:hypothetical protein